MPVAPLAGYLQLGHLDGLLLALRFVQQGGLLTQLRGLARQLDEDRDLGADDARRHRIVVPERTAQPRYAKATEEHRAMVKRDDPVTAGDRSCGVDHGQVDLLGDEVEKRGAVRRRLGRDDRDARHPRSAFIAAFRAFQSRP